MLLCAGFLAAPGQAAEIPVLRADGTVTERLDPGVAAVGEHVPAAPARAVASARTARSELRRIYDAGAITREEYVAYRDEYDRDKAFTKKLSGARRLDMGGQLSVLNRIAARGSLTSSRLPALWLQLRRNREWWSTGPLLSSGARVSFDGSELVYQYVPNEGLQIHPLANFGKLNALWRSKVDADRMRLLLDELLPLAAGRSGGVAWEYYFDFGGGAPPWVSSLAQGTGLQSMARAATKAGTAELVLPTLRKGLGIFRKRPPSGVRVQVPGPGVHYAQYSFAPGLRIINGFVQSLVGLFDYASLSGSTTAQKLFNQGNARAAREVPTYDTGAWSLYDRGTDSHESDLNYHNVLIDFLTSLCDRTGQKVYCGAQDHFERYLEEVPEVRVLTKKLRAGHTGTLRFKLSKISRVTVQLRRGGSLVYTYSATMAYGRRGITIKPPKKARRYDVRIAATDLAGNTGTYTASVAIRRA